MNKVKIPNKIISICLTALIVIASLNIPGSGVYAAEETTEINLREGVHYVWLGDTITDEEEVSYTISEGGSYSINVPFSSTLELRYGMENFDLVSSLTVAGEGYDGGAALIVQSGLDISLNNLTNLATEARVDNYGTVRFSTFNPGSTFLNQSEAATVIADNMYLGLDNVAGSRGTFIVNDGGSINISGFDDMMHPSFSLELPYNATVTSGGGTFDVIIDRESDYKSDVVSLTGSHSGEKVNEIFPEESVEPISIELSIGDEEDNTVYIGTNPEDTFKIKVFSEEHEGEVSLDELGEDILYSYCDDSYGDPEWIDGLPDSSITQSTGSYRIRAYFEGNSVYGEAEEEISFEVKFLPLEEMPKAQDGNYVSISGLYNDVYAKESIVIQPASGCMIKDSYGSEFESFMTIDHDYLYRETYGYNFNYDLEFYLKKGGGAETYMQTYGSLGMGVLPDIIFDPDAPVITGTPKVDGRTVALSDGAELIGNALSFSIEDENLDKVTVNTTSYEVVEGKADVLIESSPETTQYVITATDFSTNELTLSITFTAQQKTPTSTVSVEDVTVGTPISPVLTTDSDGADDAEYYYKKVTEGDDKYTTTVPTAGGEYKVRVYIPATYNYEEDECFDTFKINRLTPSTATLTVPGSTAGEDYTPVLTTDSDGKDLAVIEYKKSDEDDSKYSTEKPLAKGTYIARATVPETDTYEEIKCVSEAYTISPKDPGVTSVTVDDVYVGEDYDPVLTTDSDGKDDAVFEYKKADAAESAYTEEKPAAAGEYMVRATVPETDNYEEIIVTDTFKILKNIDEEASVSVDDIYVGDSIEVVLNTDSDGQDDAVFEYKKASDPDTAYSTDEPAAAGEYSIRATIPETEAYEKIICEDTFKILKLTPERATVSVSGAVAGTDYEVSLDTDSDGKDDAEFEYKKEAEGDSEYTKTKPLAKGTYVVRATIPETDTYEEIVCVSEPYTVSAKDPGESKVYVKDTFVGEEYEPELTTGSDGKVTFEYKPADAADTDYSEEKPEAAGTYVVRATIAETDNYEEIIVVGNVFKISKRTDENASVTVADIYVGGTVTPVLTTDSDGKEDADYEYKLTSSETYSGDVPTAAGEYDVRVTVPETDNYEEVVCYDTFEIKRITPDATVSVTGAVAGTDYEVKLETNSDGGSRAEYKYKPQGVEDSEYTNTKPLAKGKYTVLVTIPETDTYEEKECFCDYTVSAKDPGESSVVIVDVYVGETYDPVLTTDSDGKADAVFEYKKTDATESTYTEEKPTAAGEYTVRATVPETDNYEKIVVTDTFKILKLHDVDATVSVDDIYVGDPIEVVLNTDSDGKEDAVFEYKKASDPDTAYSLDEPSAAGEYSIRATIPETETYEKIICEDTFKILKLNPERAAVSVAGAVAGTDYEVLLDTDSDGKDKAEFEFKKSTELDSKYTKTKPLTKGTYIVRATIPETDTYEEIVCVSDPYIISAKDPGESTVTVEDTFVGEEYEPVLVTASDGKADAVFEYKREAAAESDYTDVKPVDAGKYMVRATIPETGYYDEIVCTGTFTIKRNKAADSSITVKDIYVGETVEPILETVSDGKSDAVIEYKEISEAEDYYTEDKPAAAGEYNVRATIPETDNYEEAVCESTFKIMRHIPKTASVTVSGAVAGTNYEPVLDTDSDGKDEAVFEYKKSGEDDNAYSETKPLLRGTYVVRATVPMTDTYEAASCTSEYTISSKPIGESKVTVADTVIGTAYEPVLTTDSDGKNDAVFDYKPLDADDTAYSTEKPVAAGSYMVRASIPETGYYDAIVVTGTFNIMKKTAVTLNISIGDVYVDQPYSPLIETESDGKDAAVFEYKADGADDISFTTVKPSAAGSYVIRVTVPETDNYYAVSGSKSFSIRRYTAKASVSQVDVYAGTVYMPVVTTESDGKDSAVFRYRPYGSDDNSFSESRPVRAGKYEVRAIIPATAKFDEAVCSSTFSVKYLEAPDKAYLPSGKPGKNGWYVSDVTLMAPSNFDISTSFGGTYAASVPYSPNMLYVYLRRASDGALTDAIKMTDCYKIDKDAPRLSGLIGISGGGVVGGVGGRRLSNVVYADNYLVTVTDDHLAKVVAEGKNKRIVHGTLLLVNLSAENGVKDIVITAEDEAGNESKLSFTLKAEWLKTRLIPADKILPLSASESYKLGTGNWGVKGDPTTYKGGRSVYVSSTGKYTFTRK